MRSVALFPSVAIAKVTTQKMLASSRRALTQALSCERRSAQRAQEMQKETSRSFIFSVHT